jgi:hypothetical protein
MSKGKFGDLIQKAREGENQKVVKPESSKTRKPENQKSGNLENQNFSKPKQVTDEAMVNLGVKVSLSRRRHWAAQSKLKGVSMTDVIIRAMVEEFGEPE